VICELDLLTLFEGTEAGGVDRGVVDEHVLIATFYGNEAIALLGIEPLYGSPEPYNFSRLAR